MKLIAAVDSNWAIGNRGDMLVRIPKDQKCFREMTGGKVVVYGRKTLATFPQGQPISGCTNIILSRDKSYRVKGAKLVHSVEELLEEVKKYNSDDVYITGGESVYAQLLKYCDTAHITRIDHEYEADAYFPDLDSDPEWEITAESDEETYFDLEYHFVKYERKK
ncbi:MAG: dihydrofolate reductase [Lachnospiraceae bacterium]|nr:dihydrofolate reductase [Lachnospiraceae bacterium]